MTAGRAQRLHEAAGADPQNARSNGVHPAWWFDMLTTNRCASPNMTRSAGRRPTGRADPGPGAGLRGPRPAASIWDGPLVAKGGHQRRRRASGGRPGADGVDRLQPRGPQLGAGADAAPALPVDRPEVGAGRGHVDGAHSTAGTSRRSRDGRAGPASSPVPTSTASWPEVSRGSSDGGSLRDGIVRTMASWADEPRASDPRTRAHAGLREDKPNPGVPTTGSDPPRPHRLDRRLRRRRSMLRRGAPGRRAL